MGGIPQGHLGKQLSVAQILDQCGGEVYADFHRYYPTFNWAALFTGDLDPALFLELLAALPEDSAVRRFYAGGPSADKHLGWTQQTYLLAGIFNVLQGANWQRSGGKQQRPKPIDTPIQAAKAREREWLATRAKSIRANTLKQREQQ